MFDLASLSPEAVAALTGAAGTVVGVTVKPGFDWLQSRARTKIRAEEAVRADLLALVDQQRQELLAMRAELGEARRELRESIALHQQDVARHQHQYGELLAKYEALRTEVVLLRRELAEHDRVQS